MKIIANIIVTHLAFLAFFGGIAFAFAFAPEDDTASPPPSENLEEASDPVEPPEDSENGNRVIGDRAIEAGAKPVERRVVNTELIAERKIKLDARAQERVTNLAANMSNRVDAVIARLENIMVRIESRITKVEATGADVSAATSALASARISVDAAKVAMASIDAEVSVVVSSEDVRTAWQDVKATFSTVRDHLKTAYSEIKAAVSSLKEIVKIESESNVEAEAEVTSQ